MAEALRLGVLATHPIQYQAPLFRRLAGDPRIDLQVFFAHRPSAEERGVGFGVPFDWDVDLTSGYEHEWLRNVSKRPGLDSFGGCDTPDVGDRIVRGGFDAFLVSGWHARTYRQAMRACRDARIPLLVRGDSQLSERDPRIKRAVKRLVYPRLVRRFAVCLAVGARSAEYFREYGARAIVRAPHFVDNDFFSSRAEASRRAGDTMRDRFDVPRSALLCVFAGKLQPKKRPLDVIRAAAVARAGADVRILFAGDGELRAECEAEARRLRVPAYFAGFLNQTEMPRAYAGSDLLVLASDERETWGLVVNEAMACGLPVLVSRAAGCEPDLVAEGRTGFGFDLGDTATLGGLMARLGNDVGERARLGRAARDHVSGFSVDAAAAGVVDGATLAVEGR